MTRCGTIALVLLAACGGNADAEAARRHAAEEAARAAQQQQRAVEEGEQRDRATAAALLRAQQEEAARAAPMEAPPEGVTAVQITWTVDRSTGLADLPPGTTCTFPVAHFEATFRSDAQCRAVITCERVRLYGALRLKGFFACPTFTQEPAAVIGEDPVTFSEDGDPTLAIDTRRGTVSLHDDADGALGAFRISGHVTSVERIVPPQILWEAIEEHPGHDGYGYGS